MKIHFRRAIIAGVLGTVAFDLAGWALTGTFWDIPALLGSKVFGEGTLAAGVAGHYGIGALLAVIYAGVAPSLWGNAWARALTFVTLETVFGVWLFMLPLLGAGPAGLKVSALMPVITLARHWAYAVPLALLYPLEQEDRVRAVGLARAR